MLKSLISAFTMYSRLPVPSSLQKGEPGRYSVCFFPAVGMVTGALEYGLFRLGMHLTPAAPRPSILIPALMTALPLIVTGGIHFDGFLDTSDALASWKSREEKLRIMKDPHPGAFAIIRGILIELLYLGFFSAAGEGAVRTACAGFVLSRAMSGWSLMALPKARQDGMLKTEAERQAGPVKTVLFAEMLLLAAVMLLMSPVCGAAGAAAAFLTMFHYHRTALKEFGGTTGDLAGWFLVRCEVFVLAAAVAAEICMGMIR